jgi:hypothetical protein
MDRRKSLEAARQYCRIRAIITSWDQAIAFDDPAWLVSRLGSSMKKYFAFGEAVGLTPFGPRDPAARRGETAPCPPLRREVAIDTAECGGEGEELKEAGGRRPPPPSKPHPSPGLTPSCGGSHSPGEG